MPADRAPRSSSTEGVHYSLAKTSRRASIWSALLVLFNAELG
jgi:hypothetical protein